QRQRHAHDDTLGPFVADQGDEPVEARAARGPLDDAERPSERAGRIGDGHAGACGAEIEGEHLHADSAAATASLPAASASPTPSGFLPPASASVGRPPPPPPMCFPSSRTSWVASSPRPTSVSSRLTTRYARPSSTEAMIAPSARSCLRTRSERSRSGPPLSDFVCTNTTLPCLSTT